MENTFCRTCEVSFTSESHALSHYNGKKHKKRVDYSRPRPTGTRQNRSSSPSTNEEAAAAQAPPLNPVNNQSGESSPSSTRSQDYDSPDIPNESGHLFYCNVCSKNFSGPAPMKQHMQGSAHEKQSRKVRKIESLAKLEDEDLSPQLKPQSTSSKFARREYTPCPDATSTCGLKPELLQNTPTFSRYAKKPIFSHKPRLEGMRSGNFSPEKMGTVRSELIQMCIEKMKLEIVRVIPSIAESVVDALLEIYPNGKMKQEETRQDGDGRMKSQKNTISPHPQIETKEKGDDEEETSQSSSGGLFNQEQSQKEMELAIVDKKGSSPGPDQVVSEPVDESSGHRREVENLQVENDLDGSNCSRSLGRNPTLNFSNIRSGRCRASSSYSKEQVEVNYETQGGGHTEQSYALEEALNWHQDTVEKHFGFREEMEERYSSVTSKDLIQLEEPSSVENEQYHSAVSMATPDEEVYYPGSLKACKKRSISLDERRLTTALQLESGPPGMQKHEMCFVADKSQGKLYPGEPPLDGESSDVSDLMTVVTEIIQALDFQAGEGGSQNLVHAQGAMCSLQPDK